MNIEHARCGHRTMVVQRIGGIDNAQAINVEGVGIDIGSERACRYRPYALIILGHFGTLGLHAACKHCTTHHHLLGIGSHMTEGYGMIVVHLGRDHTCAHRSQSLGIGLRIVGLVDPRLLCRRGKGHGHHCAKKEKSFHSV